MKQFTHRTTKLLVEVVKVLDGMVEYRQPPRQYASRFLGQEEFDSRYEPVERGIYDSEGKIEPPKHPVGAVVMLNSGGPRMTVTILGGNERFCEWDGGHSWFPTASLTPIDTTATPCPCTMIEQSEDCPIGYPSMVCGVCEGKGHTTPDKISALACEMIKIAQDVGEPDDPFAAWETISLFKTEYERMQREHGPSAALAMHDYVAGEPSIYTPLRIYPDEMTDEIRAVLQLMVWNTGGLARALRIGGEEIETAAEVEQSHVLHWLIKLALDHGDKWRDMVGKRLDEIKAQTKEKADE